GDTIAFIKDLYNRGVISKKETGGISLEWDDADVQIELIHKTARREGFGNIVAEGLYSVAKIFGMEAMQYCYHTKGLSKGAHPVGNRSLSHATST
ncbi:MAG: aldehyde ferredoxin oxidoreductase C-terminal domain-containing protein, partial [Candidatus Hodarchaeota archaeon]